MKLLKSDTSPFVRKVKVVILETGQADDIEMVDLTTTPMASDPALIAANPMGKIPCLVRDDGPAIYDSRVICRFLDARAGAGLYRNDAIETLTLEATADAMMEAAVAMVYEARFREAEKVSHDWIDAQWAKVARGLDALNTRWMSHLYGKTDIGHIGVACALGYLDFRHDARAWRQGRDALAAWAKDFAARPSMTATAPHG